MNAITQVRNEAAIIPTDATGRHEVRGHRHPRRGCRSRPRSFYSNLGWRLDADFAVGDNFRVVQFTPPGSPASIHFGKGVSSAAPGSASGLYLVVSDIVAARAELIGHGADVGEIFHVAGPGQPLLQRPRIRSGAATSRTPRSRIRTATPGCCRRSPRVSRGGSTLTNTTFASVGRPGERFPARGDRARRAREADRCARCELGGLVRRVHRRGAGRQGAAAVSQRQRHGHRARPR